MYPNGDGRELVLSVRARPAGCRCRQAYPQKLRSGWCGRSARSGGDRTRQYLNSPWLKSLVDSGAIFHPLAWTPVEAYRFLQDVPAFEASGVVVRIPDWWRPRLPPRPQIDIRLGHQVAGLGLAAMLDFRVDLTLDGEALSDEEWQQVLAAGDGLMRLKGRWVEVDREAQAIKNPGTRQTRAVKRLPSRVRLALTGTPVENRLGDISASLALSSLRRAWYDARSSRIAAQPQESVMGLMERLQEIAKVLPENELAEVIGFAEALKARHGATRIAAPDAAIDVELMHAVRSRCEGGFTWRREELYDRGIR